jgi:small GTP-binding protein
MHASKVRWRSPVGDRIGVSKGSSVSDIFVSYARQDRLLAGELVYALRNEGWSVWWDSELLPGQSFTPTIERELRNARCVVAIWSRQSLESSWVRDEVTQAHLDRRLIPVVIDDILPPLGFRQTECADLWGWDGSVSHPGFVAATRAIHLLAGPPTPPFATNLSRKICLVGASGVGKTSLVGRFVSSVFSEKYMTTVGVKIERKHVDVSGKSMSLVVWDIEGHDDLREPRPSYFNGMSGYLLVIDGTRPRTLDKALAIEEWIRNTSRAPIPHVALINKADLRDEWVLHDQAIESLRGRTWDVRVVSAKTGTGVDEAFRALAERLLSRSWTFQDLRTFDADFGGDPISEERLLRAALARDSGNFLAWARLAGIFARRGDVSLVRRAIVRAEGSTPDTPQAHFCVADELTRSDQLLAAARHLERAIELGVECVPDARQLLATTYVRLGSARKAVEQYERLLEAGPAEHVREEIENRLRELRNLNRDLDMSKDAPAEGPRG